MSKFLCDINDIDKQGRDIRNDRLAPGGRRRKNGTLSAMAHNFQEIPDNMVLTDRRNVKKPEPGVIDLIVVRLKIYAADKITEITMNDADKGVDWIGQKLADIIQEVRDTRAEYKAIKAAGYNTKAEMLLGEKRKEALKMPNVIDFEAKRREMKAV